METAAYSKPGWIGDVRVKICGTTSETDARLAVSLGADALGFLIGLDYRTVDEINQRDAKSIIAALPPFVSAVLVTHRTEAGWIAETCLDLACNAVQLHGPFPLEQMGHLRRMLPHVKIIKTIHVDGEQAIARSIEASRLVDAILLDTITSDRIGGTGKTHDWSISAKIAESVKIPVILAGGLTPENVKDAILRVKPFAVDVNSGVENPDGTKAAERIKAFVLRAREAFDALGNTSLRREA